ncbi:1,4-alpha-glucan branching protein GlgB [Bythopirellula polymerisocia]|uniref:1,4-alpha-glucan branching enzyme GlgB n=1 Tax=Bythopirellula polymerisocia TaxID=2528003 RepID=A0A5C6CNU3_9BACT|nr:1,4-alpha-glucan branching protein GlgB [Bythopirellula polymerisocia]TWU25775.1 1,4-alpha-glucan branching enzyme GlgB [Bythopirellula polymerisocia]
MRTQVDLNAIAPVVHGYHNNPFEVLGPHEIEDEGRRALAIRAYLPETKQVWLVDKQHGLWQPMRRIHPAGLYEAICEPEVYNRKQGRNYQFCSVNQAGEQTTMHDPYSFPTLLTDYDLHLLGEGRHWDSYRRLGAHLREIDGIKGVNFAVWAPNAESVSVVGDFNGWDRRKHAMRKHLPGGTWELFIPELGLGTLYKFSVKNHGNVVEKCDPYGFAAEVPPKTANIVSDLDGFQWSDEEWIAKRANHNPLTAPLSIYEVHLGSWQRGDDWQHPWLNYRDLAHRLAAYCEKLGFTHIELMPVSEHPFTGSWGYQTVGYFAATSRYGTPEDFQYFVDYLHQHNIGVLIDWVPAHFPKDSHGLDFFDGSALYEHADPRQGEHPDWGTKIFNYGRNEVRNFLTSNALFWLDKYHIDGLRVDAVASMLYLDYSREDGDWIPNQYGGRENLAAIDFLKEFNEQVHLQYPGVLTVAEESTAWGGVSRPTYVGGLGFSMKWNMGWMNDTLRYFRHEPIHRGYHHDELTFSLIYAFTENFVLPFSHDEVVHGKGSMLDQMPGDLWQRFANLRLLYGYQWTHPGKKLTFMGGEIAQWNEWNCDENLQWDLLEWESHQGVQRLVADLNKLYCNDPALHQQDFDHTGFEWVDCHNHNDSVLVYLRRGTNPQDFVLVACNFTPVVRKNYRIGVPEGGWYAEVMNTDSKYYGGSNVGNYPGLQAEESESHGRPYSLLMTLPPLAVVVFKPQRG